MFAMCFAGCDALSEKSCSYVHHISHWFDTDTAIQNTTAQNADNFTPKILKPEAQGLSEKESWEKSIVISHQNHSKAFSLPQGPSNVTYASWVPCGPVMPLLFTAPAN